MRHGLAGPAGAEMPDVLERETLLLEELDNLFADLETGGADGRADGDLQLLRAAAETLLHLEEHLLRDALDGPLPTGMDGRDDAPLGIINENGNAVRGVHADRDAGQGGHQRVVAVELLLALPGAVHHRHAEAVDLVRLDDGIRQHAVAAGGECLDSGTEIVAEKCFGCGHYESKYTFFS